MKINLFRRRTADKAMVDVLVVERVGLRRWRTPEGYLYCEAVPCARVGTMMYAEGEVPLDAQGGVIRVTRGADELFAPSTLASYNGKPVIDDHPDKDNLSAENYREHSQRVIGVALNPRRGDGTDEDVMLVDLIIMDARAIRDVEAGKVEVSAGYEADYEQTGPGEGRQRNIIGNHIALVERGRCGPRCAIGDHQPQELTHMADRNPKRRAVLQEAVRRVFKDAEAALNDELENPVGGLPPDDDDDDHTHIHIHTGEGGSAAAPTQDDPIEQRFAALEEQHRQILARLDALDAKLGGGGGEGNDADPFNAGPDLSAGGESDGPADANALGGADDDNVDGVKDAMPEELEAAKKAKTGDSAALSASFQAVLADAEVLVPGFRMPTFDAKRGRKATLDAMCGFRRDVLRHLSTTVDGAAAIEAMAGKGFDPAKASCVSVATTFRAAAGMRRLVNNNAATGDSRRLPGIVDDAPKPVMTLAQLNELHRDFYAGKTH